MPWKLPVSMTTSEIHLRWANLRREPGSGSDIEVSASDLGVDTGYGAALLSLSPEGKAQLLLPVAAGTRRPVLRELPALEVGATRLTDTVGSRPYLVITCLDPRLDRPFADLVLAIISRISDGESSTSALTAAVDELRLLFGAAVTAKIGIERIQGLAGELIVLLRLVKLSPRAIELWSGPDEHRHDFRGGPHAIEVKTTRRQSGQVTISSIDQLEVPAGGSLELRRIVLEQTSNGSITIGGLVSKIEDFTGRSTLLRDRLTLLGCPDPDAENWNAVTFNAESMDGYRVDAGFPRIVAGSFGSPGLPPGVVGLGYSIDLGQAHEFALTTEEMKASEERIAACLN